MIFVCAMALAHPVWRHWYELIFPPLLAIMAVLALGYAMPQVTVADCRPALSRRNELNNSLSYKPFHKCLGKFRPRKLRSATCR
jgi:hypothetical protein